MRRALLLLLCLPPSLAVADPDPIVYVITQNGTKIGENVYAPLIDGSFTSETKIEVAGIKIGSNLKGQFKNGKLATFDMKQKVPQSDVTVKYADGKISAVVNGKAQPAQKVELSKALFSNYHPGVTRTIFANLSTNVEGAQKVKITVLDGGASLDVNIIPKTPRKIERDGETIAIRPYTVQLGGLDIEFAVGPGGLVVGESVASQKVSFIAEGYEAAFIDPVAKYKELSQPTYEVKVEKGVQVKMRDGVTLVHDVAMPVGEGKFPTILVRTPYGRAGNMLGAEWWARRGYVYISQDCRGRHDSEGDWDPFVPERKDGKDTIDWIAAQPWSDGKVGMIGGSYSGYVQWAAAVEKPEALKCIVPQVSPPDAMLNIPYDHGTFMLLPNLWWTNLIRDKVSRMERATQPLPHPDKLLTLPLSKMDDAVLGVNVPFFDNWLKREGMDSWKDKFDIVSFMPQVEIPALHISGWWDGDGIGTKTNWATMRAAGRQNQWLIYGPWPHGFNASTKFGDLDYGPTAVLELESVYLRWFDTWLKDKQVSWDKTPKVQAFVTGANKWALLKDWPESASPEQKLFFANGKDLLATPKAKGASANYVYDPAKIKLPNFKNRNLMEESTTKIDLNDFNGDGVVLRSAPMKDPLTIGGPISVDLYFSTNVVSTDFFAYLVDIDPKGVARLIAMPGKIDVRYLNGLDKPRLIKPGQVYKASVDIWDTAHQFKKGHRIAVAINSSMFPSYARNLNTGEPLFSATKMKVAKQVIYQDAKRPSVLRFRVLKG